MEGKNNLKKSVVLEWLLFGAQALLTVAVFVLIAIAGAVISENNSNNGSGDLGEAVLVIVMAIILVLSIIASVPMIISTGLSLAFSVGLTRTYKYGKPEKFFVLKGILKIVFFLIIGGFFGYMSVQIITTSPVWGIVMAVYVLFVLTLLVITAIGCFSRKKKKPVDANVVE